MTRALAFLLYVAVRFVWTVLVVLTTLLVLVLFGAAVADGNVLWALIGLLPLSILLKLTERL